MGYSCIADDLVYDEERGLLVDFVFQPATKNSGRMLKYTAPFFKCVALLSSEK